MRSALFLPNGVNFYCWICFVEISICICYFSSVLRYACHPLKVHVRKITAQITPFEERIEQPQFAKSKFRHEETPFFFWLLKVRMTTQTLHDTRYINLHNNMQLAYIVTSAGFVFLFISLSVVEVKTQSIVCSPVLNYANSSFCGTLVLFSFPFSSSPLQLPLLFPSLYSRFPTCLKY